MGGSSQLCLFVLDGASSAMPMIVPGMKGCSWLGTGLHAMLCSLPHSTACWGPVLRCPALLPCNECVPKKAFCACALEGSPLACVNVSPSSGHSFAHGQDLGCDPAAQWHSTA